MTVVRLPDPDRSRAVLVGVSVYRDPRLPDLPAVAHNLTDLQKLLVAPGPGGLRPKVCHVESRPRVPHQIGVTLDEIAKHAQDTLIVYYAGHGLLDRHGELYLALGDTNIDHLLHTALPFSTVRHVLLDSPAAARVLILDCCFSGRAVETMSGVAAAIAGQIEVAGAFTLTATPANLPAHAPPGARHTAFTGRLVSLLRDGAPDGPDLLSLGDIYLWLLRDAMARGRPAPQQRGTATVGMLALARNAAFVPGPPPAPTGGSAPVRPTRPGYSRRTQMRVASGVLAAVLTLVAFLLSGDRPVRPLPASGYAWSVTAGPDCPPSVDYSSEPDATPPDAWKPITLTTAADGCGTTGLFATTADSPSKQAPAYMWTFHPVGLRTCLVEVYFPEVDVLEKGGDLRYRLGADPTGDKNKVVIFDQQQALHFGWLTVDSDVEATNPLYLLLVARSDGISYPVVASTARARCR